MGSWNGTCGISQMSIPVGEKVRVFLLLQSEYAKGINGAGTCYSTAYFRPWFLSVTAEYNDYGSIENIQDDWHTKYMIETFRTWHKSGKVKIIDENDTENSPGVNFTDTKEFKELTDVFDCVERGTLLCKNEGEDFDKEKQEWVPSRGYLRVAMFMILEDVYQKVLVESYRFMEKEYNVYWKKRNEEEKTKFFEGAKLIRENRGLLSESVKVFTDIQLEKFFSDPIEEHQAYKHYKTLIYDYPDVSLDDIYTRINDYVKISMAISFLRKLWFPQTGQGSQSDELDFTKALIRGMNKFVSKRETELEKYRLEDEAWEKELEEKKKKNEN